jgi:acyl transferase domain-containing protein
MYCPCFVSHPIRYFFIRTERCNCRANGFAGTVAGAILEAPVLPTLQSSSGNSTSPMLFVLSAKTQVALVQYVQDYIQFCKHADTSDFSSICYTSCLGREHYKYRFTCVTRSVVELLEKLEGELTRLRSTKIDVNRPFPVLGFPGQGAQYQGMARALSLRYPRFLSILSQTADTASDAAGFPVFPYLFDKESPAGSSLDESYFGQICTFVFQCTMYQWLDALGIQPQAVIGHSLGEIPAAGTFTCLLCVTSESLLILLQLPAVHSRLISLSNLYASVLSF